MAKIIEIVGTSGSGKSTVHEKISAYARGLGYEVVDFIQPGPLRSLAKQYRSLPADDRNPLTESAIFATDRLISYTDLVFPRQDDEKLLFSIARGFPDSITYQGIIGKVPIETLMQMNASIPRADLYLCLVVDGLTGHQRALKRVGEGGDPVSKSELPEAIDRLRSAYVQTAKYFDNFNIIDTSSLSPQQTFDVCKRYVDGVLE